MPSRMFSDRTRWFFWTNCAQSPARTGAQTFILSNEGLFGEGGSALKIFIDEIGRQSDLKIIAYMRPVREWLPSAFAQWGVRHKTYEGPIQPFRQRAPHLIKQYAGIRAWNENFKSALTVRKHTKSTDVVADFAETIGLDISSDKRRLERSEPADMVLQALVQQSVPAWRLPGAVPEPCPVI